MKPHQTLYLRLTILLLLNALDLALNSTIEYDITTDRNSQVLTFGVQIVAQTLVVAVVFTSFGDTFLFRVGLVDVMWDRFMGVLVVVPVYGFVGIVVGSYRIRRFDDIDDLWNLPLYKVISILHKILAPLYYAMTISCVMELSESKYHTKEAWVDAFCKDDKANDKGMRRLS
mmetsp:Transcript_14789/g.18629  ORF Transcript_14789/g.18629 Transcript_14789/m.18629 type:complete len:172 (+) Transcript_14789:152-667(+)